MRIRRTTIYYIKRHHKSNIFFYFDSGKGQPYVQWLLWLKNKYKIIAITMCYKICRIVYIFWSKFAVNQSGISNVNAMLLLLPFCTIKQESEIIIENKLSALRSGIKKHLDIVKCIIQHYIFSDCLLSYILGWLQIFTTTLWFFQLIYVDRAKDDALSN